MVLSLVAAASMVAASAGPSLAARQKQRQPSRNLTRAQGGPSALGGLPGTGAGQMVRVQQQRAQRGAARKRISARDRIIAARDLQQSRNSGQGFSSRHEAAAYTRMRARIVQLRTFAVAVAVGIGSGFFAKMMSAMGVLHSHIAPGEPHWGNPMVQMLDHHFLIGAVIGAGATLVIGSVRAAHLRHRADAIERGDVDFDID